ncbi:MULTISPECIES: hypothetical protein [Bacillus cereus group]|uniref:hypothetical protein n=1 Tax=Bacillus cereus group TaxID=86661 RepID=UPI001F0AAA02|nr:hypothetical protein [Bacillus cereus]
MRRKGYFIDNESKRLYNNEIVVSNKVYPNNPTLAELKKCLYPIILTIEKVI